MRAVAVGLVATAGLVLASCGSVQSATSPSPTVSGSNANPSPSATSATASVSASSATPSPSGTAQVAWKTYVSARWGYSIAYPANWYDLPNSGAPDTQKYFSSENVGAPLLMSSRGVWETIEVQPYSAASCPASYVTSSAARQSPITVDGVATTRYVINMTPSGAEASYGIGVWVKDGASCYSIQFDSPTASTRDANAGIDDQAIASFKFGS